MTAILILFGVLVVITLIKGSIYFLSFVASLLWNVGPYVVMLVVVLTLYYLVGSP